MTINKVPARLGQKSRACLERAEETAADKDAADAWPRRQTPDAAECPHHQLAERSAGAASPPDWRPESGSGMPADDGRLA